MIKKNNKKIIVFISLIIFYVFTNLPVATGIMSTGDIFYVGGNEQGNYSSILNAIYNASEGDTIIVSNGIYNENIIVNKSIQLIGEDKEQTIINGSINGNIITLTSNSVTITGFTIQYSGSIFPNAGINVTSNYNNISGNILKNNFYGMTLFSASNNIISENTISNNNQCGIYMSDSSNNIITENTIKYNRYNGIGLYDSSNSNTIKNNILTNNNYCGINIAISSCNIITTNTITDNNNGIQLSHSQYKNQISNNVYSNNKNDFIVLGGFPTFQLIIVVISLIIMTVFIVFWREKKGKKTQSSKESKNSLDTRGNPCPIPLIMTKKKIAKMKKGETLEIITTDIVAKENIERYAIEKYELVRIDKKGELFKIYIKK
jgi:parallel beta-helix repeat protein